MKLTKSLLTILTTVIIYGFFSGSQVLASTHTTSFQYPTSVIFGGNWSSSSNLLGAPNSTYSSVVSNNLTLQLQYAGFGIPTGSTINKVTVRVYGNTSGNSGGTNRLDLSNSSFSTSCDAGTNNPLIPLNNNTYDFDISSTNCPNWSTQGTVTNLNSNPGLWMRNDSNKNANWDTAGLGVTYSDPLPTLAITSEIASKSAGTTTINVTGDTHYTAQPNKCIISFFLNDLTGHGDHAIAGLQAVVLLDTGASNSATVKLGGNRYQGYGYALGDSTWAADGIVLPYLPNVSASIAYGTKCWLADGTTVVNNQGFDPTVTDGTYDPSLVATNSAITTTYAAKVQDCTNDVICAFQAWIYNTLNDIFGFSVFFNPDEWKPLWQLANARVPFAYINAITGVNLTATGATQDTPRLQVACPSITLLHCPGSGYIIDVDVSSNTAVTTVQAWARPIFIVLIWGLFIFGYLLHRGRDL